VRPNSTGDAVESHHLDRVGALVAAHADALLRDLERLGSDPSARSAALSAGGWRVRVEASPAGPAGLAPGLNACGRAAAELLWDAAEPLSAERVRDELEKKGRLFGLITVQRALRELHRRHKAIAHSAHKPRGYYFPQRLPLFRADDARERAFAARLASRLRASRESAGLTAGQLAAASGVSEAVIRDGESGAGLPSLRESAALAAALGVGLSALVAADDN
jgi:hypothetical protein